MGIVGKQTSKYTDIELPLCLGGSIHWCFTQLFFSAEAYGLVVFIGNIQLAYATNRLWIHQTIIRYYSLSGHGDAAAFYEFCYFTTHDCLAHGGICIVLSND